MSRNATASVAITANIQAYAQEIGKLPDVTSEAAIKAGAKLEAQFQKRLDAVAKEARAAAAQVSQSTGKAAEGAVDAGRAISGIEGVGRIFGGTIGEVTGALGDMEAVFGALPAAAGAAGLALGAVAAAALYFYNKSAEARKEAEEFAKNLETIAKEAGPLTAAVLEENAALVAQLAESQRQAEDATAALAARQALDLAPSIIGANNALVAQELYAKKAAGELTGFSDAELAQIEATAQKAAYTIEGFGAKTGEATYSADRYAKAWGFAALEIERARGEQAALNDEIGRGTVLLDEFEAEGTNGVLFSQEEQKAQAEKNEQARAAAREARAKAQAAAEKARAEAQRKAEQARAAAAKKREEAERKAAEAARQALEEERKAAQALADTLNQLFEIQNRGQLDFLSQEEQLESAYYRQIEAIQELAKAQEGNAQVQAEAQAAELAALGEYQIKVKELRDAADAERLEKERQTSEQIKALREEELNALAENQAKQREALFNTIQVGLEAASEVSGLIQEVMAEYAQSYDTTTEMGRMAARKQFAINKAFALGDIAIKTAQAVVGFLAMVPPNPVGAVFAGVTGATQAAIVAARQPTFHVGRFTRQGNLVTDEQPAILRRGEVVVPSPMVAAAGGPEAVRERLQGGGSSPNVMLVADFQDRRVTVPLARAVRSANRPGAVGWRR